uniref:Ammonium transporter AmtB-like domain-containing protein n=2 Tax=Cellia TaxID=44534 RepID=A0A182MJC6_9DIPT
MFISILFGFIFGLILGTTEMPWGFGDFPTEEMKGRGNARSLWMGILWALTSGSGVAVALLQGSAGPLIGVAISASLLPPVVNCGLFWALACIWLIYKEEDIKMPHLKGEPYSGNSSYEFIYTNYIPTEFLINGIVSGLLTVINVICIFITAIIVLKIKEVAAPYTSSPDLRR